ncbi:hypothetical protein GCM10008023_21330 [Sphingomonas glacialis]|uniref:Uncharacterized protein n=1 Tax=Sphingomonas glacialis TaxID=658225 RepID=A0ABQ3LI74_9SPHN|nr:hypothetical protein [Sphingomonas glacialis]GHH16842.1 hypothetical protein GCM10008023_21330 [Sphingomonas glacialis]
MNYARFDAASLPGQVGKDGPNGTRLSDNRSGYISYGPYFYGEPGLYIGGFYMRRTGAVVDQSFVVDVVGGAEEFAQKSIPHGDLFDDVPSLVYVNFELLEPTDGIELRVYVDEGVSIEIQSLVIIKTPQRSWGGV